MTRQQRPFAYSDSMTSLLKSARLIWAPSVEQTEQFRQTSGPNLFSLASHRITTRTPADCKSTFAEKWSALPYQLMVQMYVLVLLPRKSSRSF